MHYFCLTNKRDMSLAVKRPLVIINPISGTGSKSNVPKRFARAESEDDPTTYDFVFTEHMGHASELTHQAVDEGRKTIIAVGGDGTVNEVARAMVHSDAVLGIIPSGSGNGLARELHIPLDIKRAIQVIKNGNVTTIDCCKANDRTFFCTCGVGFDAVVSEKAQNEKKRGQLMYVKDTIETYLNYKPETYELIIDGEESIHEKAFLIAFANASQYGNNAYIAPHANIQDGQISVTILTPFTPLDVAPLAVQLFTKTIDKNSKIKTYSTRKASIIRQKPGIMHLDGEAIQGEDRIDVEVIPKALNVYTPESYTLTDEIHDFFSDVLNFMKSNFPVLT